jgi:hypothetical protein
MNQLDPKDPRPMLVLLAGVLGLATWRLLSNLHPLSLLSSAVPLAPFALGALAIALAQARQRLVCTRRTLAGRRTLALVPADGFDPGPEAVLRFASQLLRVDRGVLGWLDRRGSAIRIRLAQDPDGRLVYLLGFPARSEVLVRDALGAFRGVELRPPDEVLGDAVDDPGPPVRAELVPARPSVEPLARLALDPDPLSPIAATMASADVGQGERIEVCLDLLPAAGLRRARLRRRLRGQARRLRRRETGRLGPLLEGERRRAAGPEESFAVRQISKGLQTKLAEDGPLFEGQFLLCVRSPRRGRAKVTMQSLLSGFEASADRNWLRVAGSPLGGVGFLGADMPWRRRGFDRRLRTGLFRPARRSILGARELAGFLKPPSVHCTSENVLRSGALVSPPPALETFEAARDDLVPIGMVSGEDGRRIVGARTAESFFTYVAGRSRYGKTEAAITMFAHLVCSGHGGLFLDPHGDALVRIRPYLTEAGVRERVVEIDLGPGSRRPGPAWNLFELGGEDGEARVEAIVDAFAAAVGWEERSTRAINLTTQAAGALAAISRILPPELSPTIFQLPTLLTDDEWRGAVLPFLPEAPRSFWTERFPLLSAEAVTPVTNLVDRLRASSPTTALLGRSRGTFGVRQAMDEGLVVLACPGSGGRRERLVANLLAFDLLHAARSRAELDPARRRPFVAVFDEVQSYDGESLAALLEQSAKFGLRAIFCNQNPERLRPATLDALTTNRSHLLASALNSHAAALITKEWGGEPAAAALTRLPRYRFLAQVTDRGELSRPFALGGVRVEDALGPGRPDSLGELDDAIRGSGRVTDAAQTLADLETLDARILAALRERSGGGAGDESIRLGGPR